MLSCLLTGIHGFPYVPWNEVPGVNFTMGYCQHASILFPSWHRPYLALVEVGFLVCRKLAYG